jgi:hypothetical protein
VDAESETDYSDLDVAPRAKSGFNPSHPEGEPADGDGFGPGTTHASGSFAADHPDDVSKSNDGGVNNAQLLLSASRPGSASAGYKCITHRANKLPVNTDITQGGASYVNHDFTKKLEDRECNVSTMEHDKGGNDTSPTNGLNLFAVPGDNPAVDGNMFEPRDDQSDHTRSPQPGLAPMSAHRATGNVCRKRPRTSAPTRLANTASTISALLASTDLEGPQLVPLLAAPGQEREIRDVDQEMGDGGGTDDSDDEGYSDKRDVAASEIGCRPHFQKRARRTKDMEDDEITAPSTPSLGVSYRAAAATSCESIQESEEIPIRGYLTLKTIQSKVVYCLTFSQESLPEPSRTLRKQGSTRGVSRGSDIRDSNRLPVQARAVSRPARNSRFSAKEDDLLMQQKGEGLSWDEISMLFPERSKGTLQVHYSTKLKHRLETTKNTRKHRRSG